MTIVALHGAAMDGARFGPAPETWVWPSLPGHGQAARVTPSVADYAAAVLPALPERAVLVGHSLGGMTALQIAARHPDRVRALVMIDAPLWIPRWILPGIGLHLAPVIGRMPRLVGQVISRRTTNLAARPEIYGAIASMSQGGLGDAIVAACRFDGRPLLADLRVPTLAFFGSKSLLTNRAMRELMKVHPTTQTMTVSAGHLLQFDEPGTFAVNTAAFLERQP